jgi:hypothetical protein
MQASGSRLGRLTPGTNLRQIWNSKLSSLYSRSGCFGEEKESVSPTDNRTPDRPAHTPVTTLTTLHWILNGKRTNTVKEEVENR